MDAKEKTIALLASSAAAFDLDTADLTTLFTCPVGMKCYITKVVLRDFSITVDTVKVSFGWNALATDVVALTAALATVQFGHHIPTVLPDGMRGNAGETFRIDVETAEGEAATCQIDVFGYLAEA